MEQNYCIVYLVSRLDGYNSILSTGEKRIDMTYMSLKNNTKYLNLPVIIFHEDLTEKEMKNMKIIHNNITFEKVDFEDPKLEFINVTPCKTSKKTDLCTCEKFSCIRNKTCWRSKGYFMMCRFFTCILQNHPALQNYDGYIRFDDDSFLIEPFIPKNQFLKQVFESDYLFRTVFQDGHSSNLIYNFTKKFCQENGLDISKTMFRNGYNGIAPYNNFHATKLSAWKHPLIKKYIDKLEEEKCFLTKGFMDANVHSMIIFVLMPLVGLKVSSCTNFGYRHNYHYSAIGSENFNFINNNFFPKIDLSEINNKFLFYDFCPSICSHVLDVPKSSYLKWGINPKYESNNFNHFKVDNGDKVYVKPDLLNIFFGKYYPRIKNKFILVTSGAGLDIDDRYRKFLDKDKIIKWIGTNILFHHEKVHKIPIGFGSPERSRKGSGIPRNLISGDQELLNQFYSKKIPFEDKIDKVLLTSLGNTHKSRDFIKKIENKDLFYKLEKTSWENYMNNISQYKFVLCPRGCGTDTHRFWETLLHGSVPIVESSGLDDLYKKFPCIILENFEKLDKDTIENFNYEDEKIKNIENYLILENFVKIF